MRERDQRHGDEPAHSVPREFQKKSVSSPDMACSSCSVVEAHMARPDTCTGDTEGSPPWLQVTDYNASGT